MATAYAPLHPRKIAVLHAKALGDFVVIQPALRALKETFPSAELALLAKPWVATYLQNRPSPVDRVVAVPPCPGVHDVIETKGRTSTNRLPASSHEIDAFFAAMQREAFDIAIHLQGDGKHTNSFINRFHAKLTVGMRNSPTEPIDRFIPYIHYQNEVLRNLEIVSLVGARTLTIEPELAVTRRDRAEMKKLLPGVTATPYAVIHPGADDVRRMWPAEKFAAVADTLNQQGMRVILTGTPKEAETIRRVVQAMHHEAITCTGLSIGGLSALLAQCRLYISADTGPLHVARAVGAKTVGLYWQPNLLNWGPLSRQNHRIAISWTLQCPRCGTTPVSPWPFMPITPTCDHPYSFIESIEVDEVLALAQSLLEREDNAAELEQASKL